MPRSHDESRRDFLLLLAKAAVFVPPALATLSVDRLAAAVLQGNGGGSSGKGNGGADGTIGSLSSSGQAVQTSSFKTQGQTADRKAPWSPGTSTPAPWSRPPPTSKGGE